MIHSEVQHKQIEINGISIFYREAGNPTNETILMLHGFPSSSHMFRDMIDGLAGDFHIIAPDYPGFGFSALNSVDEYDYTFSNVAKTMEAFIAALKLDSFYVMMQDYGGPIGFRIAVHHPEKIKGLIIQNANTYMEGVGEWPQKMKALQSEKRYDELTAFTNWLMSSEGIKSIYTTGAKVPAQIDPISYLTDIAFIQRVGALDIQKALFADYGSNFPLYSKWQEYLRSHQPRTLVLWGDNDKFFNEAGADAYSKDLEEVSIHHFDAGHFMLEEQTGEAIRLIKNFLNKSN